MLVEVQGPAIISCLTSPSKLKFGTGKYCHYSCHFQKPWRPRPVKVGKESEEESRFSQCPPNLQVKMEVSHYHFQVMAASSGILDSEWNNIVSDLICLICVIMVNYHMISENNNSNTSAHTGHLFSHWHLFLPL